MDAPRVTLEDLTPIRKRLRVEVPADQVRAELDRAFQRVGQQAKLRGFRPGKAPRPVLERVFGDEIRREVLARLVEETFHAAVEHHGLAVVSTPDIDADPITPGEALRYSATVELRPEIALGDLSGLSVTTPSTVVGDEDVDRTLQAMRESVAQLRPVEDRGVIEAGDIVRVDLTSRLDGGEPVAREGVLVEAGAGSFPLALERQLVGQHRGARLTLSVPYPADHSNPGLAGKTAEFEVEVKELRSKELPPLDDDFARDHGKCDSLAELRARVRTDLERQARSRADDAVREQIIEQILARHPFDVPATLVERRTEALVASFESGLPPDANRDEARATLRERLRPRAAQQVQVELLLDAVAERERTVVTEDEVSAEIDAIAKREQQVPERMRALYDRPEARAALRARLARDRALTGLVASVRSTSASAASPMPPSAAESVAHEK